MISCAALERGTCCDCHLQGDDAIPQPPAGVEEGPDALEAVEWQPCPGGPPRPALALRQGTSMG